MLVWDRNWHVVCLLKGRALSGWFRGLVAAAGQGKRGQIRLSGVGSSALESRKAETGHEWQEGGRPRPPANSSAAKGRKTEECAVERLPFRSVCREEMSACQPAWLALARHEGETALLFSDSMPLQWEGRGAGQEGVRRQVGRTEPRRTTPRHYPSRHGRASALTAGRR